MKEPSFLKASGSNAEAYEEATYITDKAPANAGALLNSEGWEPLRLNDVDRAETLLGLLYFESDLVIFVEILTGP